MGAEHRPYLAQLKKHDPDRIDIDLNLIAALTASPGWALITDLIDAVHGEAVGRLLFMSAGAEGHVLDQAEYARLLGFLSGLREFRVAAEAVVMYAERVRTREG